MRAHKVRFVCARVRHLDHLKVADSAFEVVCLELVITVWELVCELARAAAQRPLLLPAVLC